MVFGAQTIVPQSPMLITELQGLVFTLLGLGLLLSDLPLRHFLLILYYCTLEVCNLFSEIIGTHN